MKTINCADCNVEYTYEPAKGYPDKRKYCANCSEKKKLTWEAKGEPTVSGTMEITTDADAKVVKMNEPYIQGPGNEKIYPASPKKEFHLSPEQVRTNAIDLVIKATQGAGISWELVKEVEDYLWNGK